MFDGGLFVVLNILAVVFLFKFGVAFKIVSLIIFFALGTVLLAGEDVAFQWSGTEAVSTGTAATTVEVSQTLFIIGDDDASTVNVACPRLKPNPPIAKMDVGRTEIMIPIKNFFILNSL